MFPTCKPQQRRPRGVHTPSRTSPPLRAQPMLCPRRRSPPPSTLPYVASSPGVADPRRTWHRSPVPGRRLPSRLRCSVPGRHPRRRLLELKCSWWRQGLEHPARRSSERRRTGWGGSGAGGVLAVVRAVPADPRRPAPIHAQPPLHAVLAPGRRLPIPTRCHPSSHPRVRAPTTMASWPRRRPCLCTIPSRAAQRAPAAAHVPLLLAARRERWQQPVCPSLVWRRERRRRSVRPSQFPAIKGVQ
ncbi:hypothetical protein PVAP13_8KG352900 [Panicum virgatum]|uniref:Uncharacterized protein n=1 Tax=Panicum virgatum TaxID=38727 RepID=A0A8T0PQU2_PANVG|nr:hypothetical protein PVAP13_8KG352900 [Panicum virgatum]